MCERDLICNELIQILGNFLFSHLVAQLEELQLASIPDRLRRLRLRLLGLCHAADSQG